MRSLYALAMNVVVKEAKHLSYTLYMIIPPAFALDKIHPITSEKGNRSGHMDTFVILEINMFPNKGKSSRRTLGTF